MTTTEAIQEVLSKSLKKLADTINDPTDYMKVHTEMSALVSELSRTFAIRNEQIIGAIEGMKKVDIESMTDREYQVRISSYNAALFQAQEIIRNKKWYDTILQFRRPTPNIFRKVSISYAHPIYNRNVDRVDRIISMNLTYGVVEFPDLFLPWPYRCGA